MDDNDGISENMQRLRLESGLLSRIILLRLGRRSCSDMNDNILCDMLRAINAGEDKNDAWDMLVMLLWEISENTIKYQYEELKRFNIEQQSKLTIQIL